MIGCVGADVVQLGGDDVAPYPTLPHIPGHPGRRVRGVGGIPQSAVGKLERKTGSAACMVSQPDGDAVRAELLGDPSHYRLREAIDRSLLHHRIERTGQCLDLTTRRGAIDKGDLDLSPTEFSLLEILMRHAGRPLTKTLIIEHVWDLHFESISNVVEVHINSLRNKVDKGFGPPLIQTIRGVGYIITDAPP